MNSLAEFQSKYQESFKNCSKTKKRAIFESQKQGEKFALGITDKYSAVFDGQNASQSQQNQGFQAIDACAELPRKIFLEDSRRQRTVLQRNTKEIFINTKNPKGKKWKVVDCLWSIISGSDVSVLYSPSVLRAHYGGLATCGSVWVCPVCSAKISERRKLEIVNAANLHKAAGGGLYMVTLTWAHSRHDDLQQMVKSSREALRRLRMQWAYVQSLKAIDYVGMIRAFEVTHGDANGWHPHFHELCFLKEKLTDRQLDSWKRVLFEQWKKQCLRAGLGEPNRTVGVTIIEAESAAEYIAKFGNEPRWGVGSELTKHQTKHGKNGNRSPWDLLRLYAEGEPRFGHLFREYANAFFGARQVHWSPGLKQLFGIAEMTDEALAKMHEEDAYAVCRISKMDWKKVLAQSYEARPLILELAEKGGADAVNRFLQSLVFS